MSESSGLGPVGMARASVEALRVLHAMREQGRTVATEDEQAILRGWTGWGPMAPMFKPPNDTWAGIAEQVGELLPQADVEMGLHGTYTAFYTPREVALAMWDVLKMLGFTGGGVVELGCGGGAFFDVAPQGALLTGVERDPTAAAIAAALHPEANVLVGPLESTYIGGNFAAAIGNVPFGKVQVFDPAAPHHVTENLHNYFIWRAVKALAPGGVAALLTSRWTMDGYYDDYRREIDGMADFLGAIRLASGDLGNGTDAGADIVFFRRRDGGDRSPHAWIESAASKRDDLFGEALNGWWDEHPETVLGTMRKGSTPRYGLSLVTDRDPDGPRAPDGIRNVGEMLAQIALAHDLGWREPVDPTDLGDVTDVRTQEGWYEGSYRRLANGDMVKVEGGKLVSVRTDSKAGRELAALVDLRDKVSALIEAEADWDLADEAITPLRQDTHRAYAAYVKVYGPVNRCTYREGKVDEESGLPTYTRVAPRLGGFRSDPDVALVMAIEVYDDELGTAEPAPILTARQNRRPVRPTRADSPQQALGFSLDQRAGQVDLDYIGQLLGAAPTDVPPLLGDAVYLDPESLRWVVAEEYLSGDVRRKHRVAVQAAASDPEAFDRNVTALAGVVPAWLDSSQIKAQLGSPWVDVSYVVQFAREVLGAQPKITRVAATNAYEVEAANVVRWGVAASATWGTADVDGFKLLALALNGQVPIVYRQVGESSVKDEEASMLAGEKMAALKERFSEWIWEHPVRARDLENLYNERFNCLAARKFSGAHITIDGMAPGFKPYAHQLEFVARALNTPVSLCGHPVGAGKTKTMAMVAMKLRQAGLARKPMIVVPNHLIEQIDREIRQLFPAAKILSSSAETIAANRRAFAARVATSDWDIILVTHTAFSAMPVHPETEAAYKSGQEGELWRSLVEACPDGLSGRTPKATARRMDQMGAEIDALRRKRTDIGVTFEQLGVDFLLLDEAHYYKNLSLPVRTAGFSVRPSKRATHLDVVLRYLSARPGSSRYGALFTGTPISNTMLELYVMMHYCIPEYLHKVGLGCPDAWAAAYVEFVSSIDVTVDGGSFRMKTHPAKFFNAPELRVMLSMFADIRTAKQLGLKRPAFEVIVQVTQPTAAQQVYTAELVWRAETCPKGRRRSKGDDNMLAICGDGRRMATDPALVGIDDSEPGKLDQVADNVAAEWRKAPTELQIVFCDLGTPNADKGPQTYGRLRRKLVLRGMDPKRIRFIHDAKSDADRIKLFTDCIAGNVSVIVGSTDKLGVGTNIQKHVVAMHHMDAPFRPADVEQRDGRGVRPGNIHKKIRIYRYVTERTFDAYMWQLLARKTGFITQMLSGNVGREVEDVSHEAVMSVEAIKAAATGQPLLLEKSQLDSIIKGLTTKQKGHDATQRRLAMERDNNSTTRTAAVEELVAWREIAANLTALGDGDAERLHEAMQQPAWRRTEIEVAGVKVSVGSWTTQGREPERHPLMQVGRDFINVKLYKFYKADKIAAEFLKLVGKADKRIEELTALVDRLTAELARAEELIGKPFEQAADLIRAQARLDQVKAALAAAAQGKEIPVLDPETAFIVPDDLAGEPDVDLDPDDDEQDDDVDGDAGADTHAGGDSVDLARFADMFGTLSAALDPKYSDMFAQLAAAAN